MFIQHITIENFGAIRHYDIAFRQGLNIVESRYAMELHEAIAFLVCNDQVPGIPEQWLQDSLRISATICLEDTIYTVCIRSVLGRPQMFATDPTGADATAQYQYALSHCEEWCGVVRWMGAIHSLAALRLLRLGCSGFFLGQNGSADRHKNLPSVSIGLHSLLCTRAVGQQKELFSIHQPTRQI